MKKLVGRLKAVLLAKRGFSMIELSVVITVAAAATVGAIAWTQPPIGTNATKSTITRAKMVDIQKAIDSFRAIRKRLPCPADPLMRSDGTRASIGTDYNTPTGTLHDYYSNPYGMEDLDTIQTTVNGTTTLGVDCPVSVGSVPVYSLGLDDSYISDAWGRRFTYQVASSICGTDAGTESGISSTESENIGCNELSYKNNSGNITVNNGSINLTTNAAYVLVSHGTNGYGAFLSSGVKLSASANANEAENSNGDSTYINAGISSTFDDLVLFETKNQIESLVNRKGVDAKGGVRHLSVADCEANGQALRNTSLTETNTIITQFNVLNSPNYQQNSSNIADQSILGILKATQSICISYYGATSATINGQTWSGAQCPGTANVASGSTYDAATDSCTCYSGLWDGNCSLTVGITPSTPVLTGLQIQYDASDPLTLFTDSACTTLPSNGSSIGCWKDKSGNTRNATSSSNLPTYVSSNSVLGNLPSIRFNNSSAGLAFDSLFLVNTSYTGFIVDARSANPGGYMIGTEGDWSGCGGWNNSLHYGYDQNTRIRYGQFNNDLDLNISGYSSPASSMHRFMLNTASGRSINARYSGSDHTISNAATSGLCTLMYANSGRIGTNGNGLTHYNGDIAEVILYNRALSAGEITSVETYLKSKWGVQ